MTTRGLTENLYKNRHPGPFPDHAYLGTQMPYLSKGLGAYCPESWKKRDYGLGECNMYLSVKGQNKIMGLYS